MRSIKWIAPAAAWVVVGCNASSDYTIEGAIEKGPFVEGTEVTVRELDQDLIATGQTYSAVVEDDAGSFSVDATLSSPYVELSADGFYFNEVEGDLSAAPITLRAFADIDENETVNVNVLTHLEHPRVATLVDAGESFSDAKAQARGELLSAFNIEEDVAAPETLTISEAGVNNAILLAVAVTVQGEQTEAELTELLAQLSSDLEQNGTISETARNALRDDVTGLDLREIREQVEGRYAQLGHDLEAPPFEAFLDSTGDGTLNHEDLAVSGLQPENGTHVRTDQPTLQWDPVPGAASFEVQIAEAEDELSSASPLETPINEINPVLDRGHALYWRVRAVGRLDGEPSEWSEVKQLEVPAYFVAETGPAGGVIIYDREFGVSDDVIEEDESISGDWRYMEMAPEVPEDEVNWGNLGVLVNDTSEGVGAGPSNTEAMREALEDGNAADTAHDVELEHEGETFSDWLLPSKEELHLFAYVIDQNFDDIEFNEGTFWSSSEIDQDNAYSVELPSAARTQTEKSENLSLQLMRVFP